MTPKEIALTICEPWMNGDPCEGCDCEKVCRKLIQRIETEIEFERAKTQTYKNFAAITEASMQRLTDVQQKMKHIGDANKMVCREWVGLTDEEIEYLDMETSGTVFDFVHAIEAKLKEKNS